LSNPIIYNNKGLRGGARNLSSGGPNAKNNIIKEKLIFKCIIGKSNIKNKEAKNK
jgi:hypothetical protein